MKYYVKGKEIPVVYDVDTIIVGGGTSGVAAAYTAAKNNKVLIIEKQLSLTGTQANGLVTPMMHSQLRRYSFNKISLSKLKDYTGNPTEPNEEATTRWFSPQPYEYVVEKMLTEKNIDILFDAQVIDVVIEDSKIVALIVISFNHLIAVKAKNFVDASGDAWLARLSGIPTVSGDDGQYSSLSLRMEIGNINIEELKEWCHHKNYAFSDPLGDRRFFEFVYVPNQPLIGNISEVFLRAVETGDLKPEDIRYIQGFTIPGKEGVMSFNNPQLPSKFKPDNPLDMSKAAIYGHEMQERLINFFKKEIPGFQKSFISKRASMIGIRDSYRIIGKYIMTEKDYLNRKKFSDGVADGDWYMDVHGDEDDIDVKGRKLAYSKNEYYQVPYRALVVDEIENYIAVGRHISATFLMQSSLRIQVLCQDMGEVAGYACIYSIENSIPLNEIDGKKVREIIDKNISTIN